MQRTPVTDCDRCGGGIERRVGNPAVSVRPMSYKCRQCGAEPINCDVCEEFAYEYNVTTYDAPAAPSRDPRVGYDEERGGHTKPETIYTCLGCDPHAAAEFRNEHFTEHTKTTA